MEILNWKQLLTENEFEKLRILKQNMSLEQINKLKEDYGSKKIINNLSKISDLREFNINDIRKYNLSKNTNMFDIVHYHSHVIVVYQSLQLSINDAFTDMYFIEWNYGYYILKKFTALKIAFIRYQALIDKVDSLSARIKPKNKIEKVINLNHSINIWKLLIYRFELNDRDKKTLKNSTLSFKALVNNSKHCDDILSTIQIMLTTNQFLIPNSHKYNDNWKETSITEIGSLEHDNSEISYLFYEECLKKLIIATNEVVEFANKQLEILYKTIDETI